MIFPHISLPEQLSARWRSAASLSVLVADADSAYRLAVGSLLRQGGFRMFSADRECDALAFLAGLDRSRPSPVREPVHLCLVDDRLPGRAGLVVVRAMASLRPDCPVVVVSSLPDPGRRRAALRHGASLYGPKPASVSAVLALLEHALRAAQGGEVTRPGPRTALPT